MVNYVTVYFMIVENFVATVVMLMLCNALWIAVGAVGNMKSYNCVFCADMLMFCLHDLLYTHLECSFFSHGFKSHIYIHYIWYIDL